MDSSIYQNTELVSNLLNTFTLLSWTKIWSMDGKMCLYLLTHHLPHMDFPAINALNLVANACDITVSAETVVTRFSQQFSGLEQLQGEYNIKLNCDATSFGLSTPRWISLPQMD